jgi:hypothetical protein
MTKTVCLLFVLTVAAAAEMWVPDGIPVQVRLGDDLVRIPADGVEQPVEFSVIEEVRVQGKAVIGVGATAIGKRVLTPGDKTHKPSMDIAIYRVQAVDGSWINLRYSAKKAENAVLIRTDQPAGRSADPEILLPRGARFALFVDEKSVQPAVTQAETKTYPSILLWLIGDIDPASIWPRQYSTWLSVAGCLLILLGLIHQRRMNRQA